MGTLTPTHFSSLLKSRCIALTGGIATGKSTVAAIIRSRGYLVFDADQLARTSVVPGKPAYEAICKHFGTGILQPNGDINRKALGQLIFSSPTARKDLEAITHPAIAAELKQLMDKNNLDQDNRIFFYEAALIHEVGKSQDFKATWCTFCPPSVQLSRLLSRGPTPMSLIQAQQALDAQMPPEEKALRSTHVINTDQSIPLIELRIDELLKSC